MSIRKKRHFPPSIPRYPARTTRSHTIEQARSERGDFTLAGRLLRWVKSADSYFGVLEDFTGHIIVAMPSWSVEGHESLVERLGEGDIVQIMGTMQKGSVAISTLCLLTPSNRGIPPRAKELRSIIAMRTRAMTAIREFFHYRGFMEIDTPTLVAYPNLEIHQEPFVTEFVNEHGFRRSLYLPSSPEYYLKQALVAGYEKIFSISRSYRNGECAPLHHPEFCLIEWYRAFASYEEIMEDIEQLVLFLNIRLNASETCRYLDKEIDLRGPWRRMTMAEAFKEYAGIEVSSWNALPLTHISTNGQKSVAEMGTQEWEDAFLTLFLEKVEPRLGTDRPVFLTEFPASMAALSKIKPTDDQVAERVELYIEGIELANGYTELNDPDEQRVRFFSDRDRKIENGTPSLPLDTNFLEALDYGMPPAGGIALGLERIMMVLLNYPDVHSLIPFPLADIEQSL